MAASRVGQISRRLLLVEDDRHAIDELRDMLSEKGFECEVTLGLETAQEILSERHMDAVIVNAKCGPLPTGGVRGLIGNLKNLAPSAKIVIFNGVTSKVLQRRLRRLGADGYLSERSDLRAVARSVERVLSQ